jgi:MinD-like ATPase involved in chromosome partitioning or flagellar assembly
MMIPVVKKQSKQQQPFSIIYPKSQAARNIREISDKLVQRALRTNCTAQRYKRFPGQAGSLMKA